MQIIERPPLTSALRANSRATRPPAAVDAVIASCHAGVYGARRRRSPPATRPAARARDAVGGEHQVEHRGHEPAADADRRGRRGASRAARAVADVEARQRDLDGLARGGRAASAPDRAPPRPQVPAALALLAVAEADRAVGHGRPPGRAVEHDRLPVGVLARARRGRRRVRKRPGTCTPSRSLERRPAAAGR